MNVFVRSRWALPLLASVIGVGLFVSTQGAEAKADGRTLSELELSAVFGDAPMSNGTPCEKEYKCNTPFIDGGTNCAFCDNSDTRRQCCVLSTGTTCDFSGDAVCEDTDRKVAASAGTGTCNTCTAASFMVSGKCTTLKNARGDACP